MAKLPLATIERILRDAGAKRVSKEASRAFSEWMENLTKKISKEAGEIAEHSGRKTILESDIHLVRRRMK